ncbi:MAG: hypothetical protein ACLRHW_07095 [Coprobacillus cateniformis]
MNENTFSKLISLRKKYNFTQQDLADNQYQTKQFLGGKLVKVILTSIYYQS